MGTLFDQLDISGKFLLLLAALIFVLFLIIAIYSFRENEKRAAIRSLLFSVTFPFIPIIASIPLLPVQPLISRIVLVFSVSLAFLLITPISASKNEKGERNKV